MAAVRDERWSLTGKTALVTGGSKGIGKAIVEELAKFGARVHVCSRSEENLNKSLQEWNETKILNVTGSICDVSIRVEREKLMKEVHSLFEGKLDILVNNVGTAIMKPATEITGEDVSFMMATNFESGFHLSQLAHPLLKASGNGNIVFVSSFASLIGMIGVSIYSSSKGAMNSLTRSLAMEWANDNIRVNCVVSGAVRTPMVEWMMSKTEIVKKPIMGRLGEPEEIASVVVFLSMPASSYVNGQVIAADAGRSINGTVP